MLLAPYLNILLGSVLPRYFLVLFATVNSDFPPQLYLCVSPKSGFLHESSRRDLMPMWVHTPVHPDLGILFKCENLCAGHTLVRECSETQVAVAAADITTINLHFIYTLKEGSTSQGTAKCVR